MINARGTFCQKIQCQEWCSVYHPSREAEMFRDSSRLRAYTAIPNAQNFGGMLSNTKLKVSGMKKPEASPQKLHGQKSGQGFTEWCQQRYNREQKRSPDQHASRTVGRSHPNREERDEHLGHGLRGRDPGALVEPSADRPADVRQAETRQTSVQS